MINEDFKMDKHSSHGNLYQFRLKVQYEIGTGVIINGPYDKYGIVLAVKDANDKGILHLIRGTCSQKTAKSYPIVL